jgi:hypothetical protein
VKAWLAGIAAHNDELHHTVSTLRGAVVLGFASGNEKDIKIRHQSIGFADMVSRTAADILAGYFAKDERSDDDNEEARAAARILHHVLSQFYFASGAFRHGGDASEDRGLSSIEAKRQFLKESRPIIERAASVGTPDTIHYLIDLLEFLMEANPEDVFELSARALLGPGREQGYQLESLGVDQVVKLIGRFLADHRELFEEPNRRRTLVKCLDVFIGAGWPSARRLLYRLPELLQ